MKAQIGDRSGSSGTLLPRTRRVFQSTRPLFPSEDRMQKDIAAPARRAPKTVRAFRVALSLGCVAALTTVTSCREGSATQKDAVVQQGTSAAEPQAVLATIGDEKITMAELRTRSAERLDNLETAYQIAKSKIVKTALDSMVRERLLAVEAKKTGKSVDSLIAAEAGSSGFVPSDADISAWYQANQSRTGGRTLQELRPQIAELLKTERRIAATKKLEERLKGEQKVAIVYQPFRLQFNNEKAPSLGKSEAPITLVEFSDFQCPFCQSAAPTLKQVEQKFGDKVRIVYRQFPLTNIHPFAFKAAEASLCANEQGKFWQLHDVMFADQKKLSVSDLKQTARSLGMDGKKFDGCLDSGRYVEQVQNDQKEGSRVGVTGTPAMFINGVSVEGGAVPYSVLEAAIQKELESRKSGS
ncbi:MAG: thioredoxin domain-containing protein [Gemmatimonadaceae bacterium]